MRDEQVQLHWPNSESLGLFNIRPIAENIDAGKVPYDIPETFGQKFERLASRKNFQLGEMGFVPEEKYVFLGQM